ncbi:hypothetical protein EV643_115199 [Kribbella sp. VKM Ac-2527]|uniref:Hemophore-related protein n=1 Tax=Kribbella caucasensis TaxID=2512215 RepID=A0A4R6K5U0_9ACTN|nr:hypothetical protein [Kribbella sp. VKM Ac-2527]TDO44697.1 hypothetical protein EV643_115199 [Kribbella sp. VKM Ac-2527]
MRHARPGSIRSRVAISGVVVVAGLIGGTSVAAAADPTPTPTPTYAPITLSPEEAQRLCTEMLPKLINRTDKLTTRINGGADVRGSVAWLKARAAKQRAKGHEKAAKQLEQRAERRAGRTADLAKAKERLEAFKTKHCQVVK